MEYDPTAIEPDDPVPPTKSENPKPEKDAEPVEDQSAPDDESVE